MERCPNCRARWDGGPACRRCGMTLELLIAVEEAADALVARGLGHLAAADADSARRDLTRALALHRDEITELLHRFTAWSDARAQDERSIAKERERAADHE